VGLDLPGRRDGPDPEESLDELQRLAESAGVEVAGRVLQRRDRPDPSTYMGRGKAAELEALREQAGANLILFDDELSPAQARNLEAILQARVLDRTQLILDIFAQRAHTTEGKLQVELAQLQYLLPRLAGKGTALSRLGGGIGTRGPGETKLETDRRRIRRRIRDLKERLEQVRRHRGLHRNFRRAMDVPVVALVGYTNAGKSSLLNALCRADVTVEDRLFATLDPTTRRLELPGGRVVLLTDTVGFIRKLPHDLVAAFRATLEEVAEADLLLHVIDVSHPGWEEQAAAVRQVLQTIGAADRLLVHVLNKADRLPGRDGQPGRLPVPVEVFLREHRDAILTSATSGEGLDALRRQVDAALASRRRRVQLAIPYADAHLLALLHRRGTVLAQAYGASAIRVEADLEPAWAERFRPWQEPDGDARRRQGEGR